MDKLTIEELEDALKYDYFWQSAKFQNRNIKGMDKAVLRQLLDTVRENERLGVLSQDLLDALKTHQENKHGLIGAAHMACNRLDNHLNPNKHLVASGSPEGQAILASTQNPLADNLVMHKNEFKIPPGTKLEKRPSQDRVRAVCAKCEQEIFYLDEHDGGCPSKAPGEK